MLAGFGEDLAKAHQENDETDAKVRSCKGPAILKYALQTDFECQAAETSPGLTIAFPAQHTSSTSTLNRWQAPIVKQAFHTPLTLQVF